MKLIHTELRYDFYKSEGMDIFWNIVPQGSPPPSSGYFNLGWIMTKKGFFYRGGKWGRNVWGDFQPLSPAAQTIFK